MKHSKNCRKRYKHYRSLQEEDFWTTNNKTYGLYQCKVLTFEITTKMRDCEAFQKLQKEIQTLPQLQEWLSYTSNLEIWKRNRAVLWLLHNKMCAAWHVYPDQSETLTWHHLKLWNISKVLTGRNIFAVVRTVWFRTGNRELRTYEIGRQWMPKILGAKNRRLIVFSQGTAVARGSIGKSNPRENSSQEVIEVWIWICYNRYYWPNEGLWPY